MPAKIWRDFTAQAVGTRPALPSAPPIAAPVQVQPEGGNASITLPVEGMDIGVSVDQNGFTVSAQPTDTVIRPPADQEPVPEEELPPVILPSGPPPGGRDREGQRERDRDRERSRDERARDAERDRERGRGNDG
jgi:hypothetical protein